jgi:hypothetical protein
MSTDYHIRGIEEIGLYRYFWVVALVCVQPYFNVGTRSIPADTDLS